MCVHVCACMLSSFVLVEEEEEGRGFVFGILDVCGGFWMVAPCD